MAKKVTIQHIAESLNLSAATVSRALNDHALISDSTKQAVNELAVRLGYSRRVGAPRASSAAQKKPVAWITPLNNFQFEDPIILEIIGGMVSRAVEVGRQFLHVPTDAAYELDTYRELIASEAVDGFVLANRLTAGDRRLEFLLDQNIPFVAYGATPVDQPYPCVEIAFAEAYRKATAYLIELGHARIALVNALPGFQTSIERERGYRSALDAFGVGASENWIFSGPKNEEFGYRSMHQLLESTPVPTAIVCSSVLGAKGAMFAIAEHGLVVGRDISLIAFDDNIAGTFYSTPLTTMFSPVRPVGRKLIDFLERAIEGEDYADLHHVQAVELVIRSSTAPAPAEQEPMRAIG